MTPTRCHLDTVEPKLPAFGSMLKEFETLIRPQVIWVRQELLQRRLLHKDDPRLDPFASLYFSVLQCHPHLSLWHLDEEVTKLLLRSATPFDYLIEKLPVLPFEGLYVTLPSYSVKMEGITKEDGEEIQINGHYEGFYLAESFITHEEGDRRALVITPIAKTEKGETFFYSLEVVEGLNEEGTPHILDVESRLWLPYIGGQVEIFHLAMNLLLALEGKYLQEESLEPRRVRDRHRSQTDPRGVKPQPYVIIHLTKVGRAHLLSREAQEEWEERKRTYGESGRTPIAHMRKEHWHSYWVLEENLGDRPVLGRRPRKGGGWLYRVKNKLDEMQVGQGQMKRPLYLVKK